jgi:hypothetical protein
MKNTSLLGQPHFELIERNGYQETVIGRYATEEEAAGMRDSRLVIYESRHLSHGVLMVRGREL